MWVQVSGGGAPALHSSVSHRMLLAHEPELLLLTGDVKKLGRGWSRVLRCEAWGVSVLEHIPGFVITLVLRRELKGHLSSHILPAVCHRLCSRFFSLCCLAVLPLGDQTCLSVLRAAQCCQSEGGSDIHPSAARRHSSLRERIGTNLPFFLQK